MLFNSYEFLIFFPVVTVLYFLLPHKYRWAMLLVASCVFYMAFIPIYILVLFATIVIDYVAAIYIAKSTGRRRKVLLAAGVVPIVLILAVFKYLDFLSGSFGAIANAFGLHYPIGVINIILPLGLSFHTFQGLSYVIEVYRGRQEPERHPGIFAVYVMFYPQLVAGPIERPSNLLHQFREVHGFDAQRVVDGLKLMLWGLFKKMVIADRLAVFVGEVYGAPEAHSGLGLALATLFFAIQIYCDFSGYSDIAIGAAQVMGFRLMTNFNRPYHAVSLSEFWKRWHISLSTWFRDYLYIPLGGNRVPKWRWQFNLFVTFLVSGLWHGANWTFVIWGALHGFYLILGLWTRGARETAARVTRLERHRTIRRMLGAVWVFVLVCFAWIFFRAESLDQAVLIVRRLFGGWQLHPSYVSATLDKMGVSAVDVVILLLSIGFMELVHLWQSSEEERRLFARSRAPVRWLIGYGLVFAILVAGVFSNNQFIYFQF
ncbi:MAG: MBOAT family protein [Actinobacteria bacterium]|nr:MBOAT family protein [Actinomycetota bacterium]